MRAALQTRALALLIALSASTVSGQQVTTTRPQRAQLPAPTVSGVIRGRIVAADTNAPLRRVQVRLSPMTAEDGTSRLATTGDDGRYEFTQLSAGRYGLKASKGGYVDGEYGQRRPFEKGRPIEIADRQVLDGVDMALPPGGVITGTVTDETGEPVARAWVQLARYRYLNGKRTLVGNYGDSTDDRGEFRIFGLPPAEYLLSASFSEFGDRAIDQVRYVRTFYPGTASPAEAQRVRVKLGGEIPGLSIALQRLRSVSVSGVVRSTTPSPFAFVRARNPDGDDSDSYIGVVDSRGAFSIAGLLPGSYVIEAHYPLGQERASLDVKVGATDVADLILTMSAGASAHGQVRFEGGTPPRDLQPSQVMLFGFEEDQFAMGGQLPAPPVRSDWTFELTGLHGRQVLTGVGGRDWRVKAVSVAGNDFTDVPIDFRNGDVTGIEIVLSKGHTEVAGRVTDSRGVVAGDATVVIFPADVEKWTKRGRIMAARPDQQGRYHVEELRAGRYLAIAVDYLEEGEEENPDLLKEWARIATSFTLADGEKRTLDLKVVNTN